MAERDLDQYLEGLGIDVDDEEESAGDSPRSDVREVDLHDPARDVGALDDDAPFHDAPYDDAPYDDAQYDDGAYGADTPGDAGRAGPDEARGLGFDDGLQFDMEAALSPTGVYGIIPDDLSPVERAESFLVNLLLNLDPAYAVEVDVVNDEIHAEILGGDSGRIIGKGGRTLAALEFLTNAVVNRVEGEGTRVVVDVGGYKRRRDERLRQSAQKAAARVRKSGYAVELEPMSAAERRVVHMAIADEPQVLSESTGEGRARRVVVKPIE